VENEEKKKKNRESAVTIGCLRLQRRHNCKHGMALISIAEQI